jgi:hypothetical protein
MLRYSLGDFNDSGFGLDASVARRWNLPFAKSFLQTGLTVRNLIEPSIRLYEEAESLPRTFALGFSFSKNLFTTYRQALDAKVWDRVTANVDFVNDGDSTRPAVGAEYAWRAGVKIRAGFNDEVTFGLGYGPAMGSFDLNYAFLFTETLPTHRMSFSYRFAEPYRTESLRIAAEVDYTDPTVELESSYRSLADHNRARVNNLVQGIGGKLDMEDVLKWLVAEPESEDAWSLYRSIGGQSGMKVRVPTNQRVRKDYLTFAVAFCNDQPDARAHGQRFVGKHGKSSIGRFVKMVLDTSKRK